MTLAYCVVLVCLWLHLFQNDILLCYLQKHGDSCYMFHVCLLLIQRLDNDSRDPPPQVSE